MYYFISFFFSLCQTFSLHNTLTCKTFSLHNTTTCQTFSLHNTITCQTFSLHNTITCQTFSLHNTITCQTFSLHNTVTQSSLGGVYCCNVTPKANKINKKNTHYSTKHLCHLLSGVVSGGGWGSGCIVSVCVCVCVVRGTFFIFFAKLCTTLPVALEIFFDSPPTTSLPSKLTKDLMSTPPPVPANLHKHPFKLLLYVWQTSVNLYETHTVQPAPLTKDDYRDAIGKFCCHKMGM